MLRYNLYAMDIDKGRNYYSCEEYGHIVRNCRNQEIVGQGKRLEYKNNQNNSNLNREENLIVLD